MPTESTDSQPDDLFFGSVVNKYITTSRFLRRDWVERDLLESTKQENCHFVLLTAEPGAGKSTFMAQFAHDHPDWPRYFILRDHRVLHRVVGAHPFLLRVSCRFAAQCPDFYSQAGR